MASNDVDQQGAAADVLEKLLRNRRSCRGFLPDPLPEATIRRALTMAQRTASWCNSQPWDPIVTSGGATDRFREALAAHMAKPENAGPRSDFPFPPKYEGVHRTRQLETARQLYESMGIEWGDRAASAKAVFENFRLFGAPHFMLITTPRLIGVYGAIDCGAYVSSFLLAAESLGFAAVPQAAIALASPFVRDYFGLSDEHMVVCGISFGLADADHPANRFMTYRAELGDAVTFLRD
jgi:nitroreductase